nr:MAG TPA: hypothetical protein [Caudoviricetes sp.]
MCHNFLCYSLVARITLILKVHLCCYFNYFRNCYIIEIAIFFKWLIQCYSFRVT